MRMILFALLCMLGVVGCDETLQDKDLGVVQPDFQCPSLPDLAVPSAKCAAARGLAGDLLANLCVDFSALPDQTLTTPPPQQLPGWFFGKDTMNNDCWEIKSGKLQIKAFGQFADTCTLKMPAINLNDADKQKFQSVTLSIIQSVDINNPNQTAQASLGSALPNRTFWTAVGKVQHQQLMIALSRTDPVPVAASQNYQYLLQLTSGGMYGLQGWQIESIAVLGNP